MNIQGVPFGTIGWGHITPIEHAGAPGKAYWRTMADHWCKRGHVLLVLEGEPVTELSDGRGPCLRRDETRPRDTTNMLGHRVQG
jgi:hypothetical protein